jgi:hypothetical protein
VGVGLLLGGGLADAGRDLSLVVGGFCRSVLEKFVRSDLGCGAVCCFVHGLQGAAALGVTVGSLVFLMEQLADVQWTGALTF